MPKEKRRESSFFLYDVGKLELNPLFSLTYVLINYLAFFTEIVTQIVDLCAFFSLISIGGKIPNINIPFLMKISV